MDAMSAMAALARSWGVEVHTLRDDHQIWLGNALRFSTEREAQEYADARFHETPDADNWRVFPSTLEPNAQWNAGYKP